MRYHFILNGYLTECQKQIQEQKAFKDRYLKEMEEGETYIYCKDAQMVSEMSTHHTEKAVVITAPEYVPEKCLKVLCELMNSEDLYIFGSDFSGIELAVRSAARSGGSSVTAVSGVDAEDNLIVRKMVYANHMEAGFQMEKGPFCISMAKGLEKSNAISGGFEICGQYEAGNGGEHITESEYHLKETVKGLEDEKIIVVAGRGIKKKENTQIIEKLAETIGGAVGVSRPAAMNAWEPMDKLVGVSGAMTGPDICITAGISGAAAFYAGIEKSGFIVAVNTDEKAPIMKMADVAIVDDFLPVLMELENILDQNKTE